MKTLTLFNAYVLADSRLAYAAEFRLYERFEMLSRQRFTLAAAIRARLAGDMRHIELTGRAPEFIQRYAAAHAEGKTLATDAQIMRWREECRSYAAEFAGSVLAANPQLREVEL